MMTKDADWCVLFDWDGVVVDSSKLHEQSWEVMAAEYGLTLPEGHFIRGFGMKNERVIPEVLGWTDDPEKIQFYAQRKEAVYRELALAAGLGPLPGVREILQALQAAGVPCSIASSTPRVNIDFILGRMGLDVYFDAITTGDQVQHGKPAPDIFLHAAGQLGGRPALVFEDALVGIEAGKRAGMAVVAVTTTHPAHELGTADRVVNRLDELSLEEARRLALVAAGRPVD
ncbi:MAG: HAD family hydrolase [Kiritimatiellia bacterium]